MNNRSMLVVESIKTCTVDRDRWTIRNFKEMSAAIPIYELPTEVKVICEMIEGKKFINANGNLVCIGLSKQVQDAIGLPMEVFETQQEELSSLSQRLSNSHSRVQVLQEDSDILYDQLQRYKKLTFWKRLKFLVWPEGEGL